MISNQKEKLAAIPELKTPEDWPRFLSQLTLIMDAVYPWVADWMHRINVLSERPTQPVLHRVAQGMGIERDQNELYQQFALDLWIVFTLKVQGDSRSIVTLIHTDMKMQNIGMCGDQRHTTSSTVSTRAGSWTNKSN